MLLKNFIILMFCYFIEVNSLESKDFDDASCEAQLGIFSDAFAKREMWALRLFDTWSKMHSGYLAGNTINYGHFTECVRFRHNEGFNNIQGQHCMVTFTSTSNSTITNDGQTNFDWREIGQVVRSENLVLRHAVCLPAVCSEQNIVTFVNNFLYKADLEARTASCRTNNPIPLSAVDILAIIIFSAFVLLLIASTIYDIIIRQKSKEPDQLFIIFSVYTNGRALFDMTKSTSPNSIDCLHGLRALSVFYIVFGHRAFFQLDFAVANPNEVAEYFNRFYSVIFTSDHLAVDTFFVIGALLVTRSTLIALDRKQLNIPRMILHRYLRYTPLFAALILYTVSLAKFAYTGPGGYNSDNCEQFWWSSLLHIQNYVNVDKLCIGHSWYLSADFQLFVISPFLIYPAWKYGKKYVWIFGLLALLSSVYVMIISLTMEVHVRPQSGEKWDLFHKWIYYPTHARMGPWFVGMILGYILYKNGNKKVEISKLANASLWIGALSLLTAVMMVSLPLSARQDNDTSLSFNAVTLGFYRLIWGTAIAIIIYCCQVIKTGGFIRWFLSLPEWQPIGRMGLSIYLVHVIYQGALIANRKQLIFAELWPMLHEYWGDLFASAILGTLLYLCFECPFLLIENYFYRKWRSEQKS